MGRARVWIEPSTGRVNVIGQGIVNGKRLTRRMSVAENNRDLADEIARELNRRFMLLDFSWLLASPAPERPTVSPATFAEWAPRWLQSYRPPTVSRRTWDNYRYSVEDLVRRIGDRHLDRVDQAALVDLRSDLERDLRERTVGGRLGVLRLIYRDALMRGVATRSPFDRPLPRRRTKRQKMQATKRFQFRPFLAAELEAFAAVLRAPRTEIEAVHFAETEGMLLTGLRWGEVLGLRWSDVSWVGGAVHVRRAIVRGQRDEDPDDGTKTGEEWSIKLRPPLAALLERQKARTFVGRSEGRIFGGPNGELSPYWRWRRLGWIEPLRRAGVAPREGDAQKAARRSFVTGSLVCGRNPKVVSAEVGHTTTRMIVQVYDSFMNPANWPDGAEIAQLRAFYGFAEGTAGVRSGTVGFGGEEPRNRN